jgi:predicted KAP-like P-loop ATPase
LAINNWNKRYIRTDDYKIIIDEPARDVPDFREHAERLPKIIVGSKPQFTVGIFGGWGTGKTTMMQMINDHIKKSYSDTVTTIWFDSWRYEREKYSLMIPLLRTIILRLHEVIDSLIGDEKKNKLKRVQMGFVKMIEAVAMGAGVNLGALTLDFAKIWDEYKSEGHVDVKGEKIYFHKHVSDYLEEELYAIKDKHRLVKS